MSYYNRDNIFNYQPTIRGPVGQQGPTGSTGSTADIFDVNGNLNMNNRLIYGLTGITFSNNTIITPGTTINSSGFATFLGQTTLTITAPIEILAPIWDGNTNTINRFLTVPLVYDLNTEFRNGVTGRTLANFYKGTPYLSFGFGGTNCHFINNAGGRNDLLRISSRNSESEIQLGNSLIDLYAGKGNTGIIRLQSPLILNTRTTAPTQTSILSSNSGVSGPTANGTMYYDTGINKIRVYDGTSWRTLAYEP
jgi:hypothetical protein